MKNTINDKFINCFDYFPFFVATRKNSRQKLKSIKFAKATCQGGFNEKKIINRAIHQHFANCEFVHIALLSPHNPKRALKDQGYESDSTLVFRKKENSIIAPLSPVEQKQAYLSLQAGGEVPMQGFRKPAPEKPKGKHILIQYKFHLIRTTTPTQKKIHPKFCDSFYSKNVIFDYWLLTTNQQFANIEKINNVSVAFVAIIQLNQVKLMG